MAANVRWEAMPDAAAVAGEGVTGFVENGVVHLDTFCEEAVTGICWQWDSDPEWVVWHEIGHVLPLIWGGPAEGRKAQCVAAAVLGRGAVRLRLHRDRPSLAGPRRRAGGARLLAVRQGTRP